nr:carcinoembryonic antigen-related cell adhesion molecule 5-like [Labrus bergylta]
MLEEKHSSVSETGVLASAAVEVEPSINPAVVGDTVILSLSPSTSIKSGSWAVGESQILTWLGEQQAVFPSHSGRASVNVLTGALTLSSVKVSDSGVYIVQGTDPQLKANTSITVLEAVSNVTLNATATSLTEFNSSAVITCSVSSGSSLSFLWINGSSVVTAGDRVQLTDGNSTLTITNVTRYDQGPFKCHVFNPVSNETSDSVNFTITYGPDNMALTVNGQNTTSFSVGSNLTMLCSVQSNPPAQLQWAFRGELVNTLGPLWELFSVSKEQSGPYSCVAFNNHSNMNSTITTNILISMPVSGVSLKADNTSLVEFNDTAVLMCSVSNGSPLSYGWMKGNSVIKAGGGVQFSDEDATLTITRVTRDDEGLFKCNVSNLLNQEVSLPVLLNVSYGPSNTKIMIMPTGYNHRTGSNVTLSCSAESSPSATIQWMLNGVYLNHLGPNLQLKMVKESDSGNYKCISHNTVTSRFSSASAMIKIVEPLGAVLLNNTGGPAIQDGTLTLHCEVTGSVTLIQCSYIWFFNSTKVANTSEYVTPPLTSDMVGMYTCMAFNGITGKNSTAHTMIKVVVGPLTPVVKGPSYAEIGQEVNFDCYAKSVPPSHYSWWYNGSEVANTSVYKTSPLTLDMSGEYTCMAYNNITGKNSTSSQRLTVIVEPKTPVIKGPSYAEIGQEVNFDCYAKSVPPSHYSWWYNGSEVANTSVYKTSPLTLDMSGEYTCMAYNNITGKNSTSSQRLTVIVGPKTPVIKGPSYAEIGQEVNFDCYAKSVPPSHYSWWYNGSEVANTSVYKTSPLTLDMSGEYTCMAYNNITGKNSTSSQRLTVIVGPKTPVIKGPSYAEIGQEVNFDCYAKSVPPSHYSWWYNGSEVANTSVYKTSPLTLDMSGEYTCMAYNNITGKNSTSSQRLTVIEAIESVKITKNTVPIISKNFTLTCEVSGPYDSIYWMKDNMHLTMNTSTAKAKSYYPEDNMLHFTPVTRNHDGMYMCVATNKAKSHLSDPYTLLVNYGPLTVKILGVNSIQIGLTAIMKCFADSRPDSEFNWFYNDLSSPLMAGSVLSFPVTNDSDGTYICKARNPVTNITMYGTKEFTAHAVGLHTQSKAALMMGLLALSVNVLFN